MEAAMAFTMPFAAFNCVCRDTTPTTNKILSTTDQMRQPTNYVL